MLVGVLTLITLNRNDHLDMLPAKAIGLGVVLLAINSILFTLIHGFIGGVPCEMAVFTMLGCLCGGRLGPFVAQHISAPTAKRVFVWIALLDGLVIIGQVTRVYWMK